MSSTRTAPEKKNYSGSATLRPQPTTLDSARSSMNIQQISNNIDVKVAQIDKQVAALKHRLTTENNSEQLNKDIAALEQIKSKLQKSRNIMWQAHELQQGSDQKRMREKRLLGIGLCVVSGLGLVAMLVFVLISK